MTRRTTRQQPEIPTTGKFVQRHAADDYAVYVDGDYIGSRATRLDAEELADSALYARLRDGAAGEFGAVAA